MVKVAIDIGHGSNTFPANGKGVYRGGKGYAEHDFNSKVAKKLKAKLEASGITVVYGPQKPNSPDVALATRTNWYNRNGVDFVISIHANAGVPNASGVCAFYWYTSSKAKNAAQKIINQIKSKGYGTHGNGLHAGMVGNWTNLHINRETNMSAVLVEHGFMTNAGDFVNIFGANQNKYVEDMADADARGVCQYFGISYKGASAKPSTPSNASTHMVQSGDTLYSIAQKYGTTANKLADINNITDAGLLQIGQTLQLKDTGKVEPVKSGDTYTVQKGDTLYGIAEDHGTTTQALVDANNISNPDLLSIGQTLTIAKPSQKESAYKPLKKGDTATIGAWATQYETGENISDWIKGSVLEVADVKYVEGTKSDKAYKLLNGQTVIGWVLEQDIVEADKGQRKDDIKKMKEQEEAVQEGDAEVVEEKPVDEAKEEEKDNPYADLKEGQFILDGKKYQVTKLNTD